MSRAFPFSFFLLLFGSLLFSSNLSSVSLGAAPPPPSVPSYSKPYVPSQAGTVNASPPVPPPSQYPPPYGSPPPPAAQNSYSPPSVPSYNQSPPPPQQGYIPPQGGTPPYNQQQPGVAIPGGQPPPPPSATNQYGQAPSYVPAARTSISSSSSFIETSPHVQPPAPPATGGLQGSSSANGQQPAKPLWQESVGSVELARHSWTGPLTYENNLGKAIVSRTTSRASRLCIGV